MEKWEEVTQSDPDDENQSGANVCLLPAQLTWQMDSKERGSTSPWQLTIYFIDLILLCVPLH